MIDFHKAICFTDHHFGRKNNDNKANQDNLQFIEFLIQNKGDAETCIFLGDWHDNRNNIGILTLNYSVQALKLLNDHFQQVFLLVGNHDMPFKDKREYHSLIHGSQFPNIKIIDEPIINNELGLIPWVIKDEIFSIHNEIVNKKTKYVFGHFEFGGFFMNSKVQIPDNHGISKDLFQEPLFVFSGHYHKRQKFRNIYYIGNTMSHDFSDENDFDRGFMIIEKNKEPIFVNWNNGPKFFNTSLTNFLNNLDDYLSSEFDCSIKLNFEENELSWEELNIVKQLLINNFNIRKLDIIQNKSNLILEDIQINNFSSIDDLVIKGIMELTSENIDNYLLKKIYEDIND